MKHPIVKALVFDMDGVLVDTKAEIEAFWLRWAEHHGIVLSPEDMTRQIHGCPTRETLAVLFSQLTPAQKEEIVREAAEMELKQIYQPVPGVLDFLEQLKKNRMWLALVTSAHPPKTQAVLSQLGLTAAFDAIVTADLVEKGKPHPACYRLAAQKLNLSPEHCLVFEDAVPGATAAKEAGMSVVGINTPDKAGRLLGVGATTVVENFSAVQLISISSSACTLTIGEWSFDLLLHSAHSLAV